MNNHLMDLAKNKLILLYILSEYPDLYTNHTLTNFILQNELMNYFFLNQYLAELINSDFVEADPQGLLHLTSLGEETLSFFKNQITKSELNQLERLLTKNQEIIQPVKYTGNIIGEDLFLQATKGRNILFEMTLKLESPSNAQAIIENFETQGESILAEINRVLKSKE